MPRKKSEVKKATWQRTFKLPANVIAAFDAVCEHFDEQPDRVARRFFEDSIRSLARDFGLHHVDEILGVEKRNPFEAFTKASQGPSFAGSVPGRPQVTLPTYEPVTMPPTTQLPAIPRGDFVLPGGGPPPPAQVDEG